MNALQCNDIEVRDTVQCSDIMLGLFCYQCYYLHQPRDTVSPLCHMPQIKCSAVILMMEMRSTLKV